jgi:outer membrane protein assembly factor BamA
MRSLSLSLCLLLAAASAFAQETRYRLERVVVEGSHIDEDIIRSETRLEEEKSYTEEDFRQGVYRVRRLPFVTDASYRIEPGVTGGGTTLVIRVLDTTAVFYGLNVGTARVGDGETDTSGDALLGGRWLLDNLGVLEAAVQKSDDDDSGFLAGLAYRAYDIYGTGAYGSLAIAQRFQTAPRKYDPTLVLNLGYPLTQRQSLTLAYSRSKTRLPLDFDVNGDDDDDPDTDGDIDDNVTLTERNRFEFADLRWWYETIDDPIFATRGVQFSAGPHWGVDELVTERYDTTQKDVVVATDTATTTLGLGLDASGYRPLTRRNSVFLRLGGDVSRTNEDNDQEFLSGAARIGITHDFHSYAENVIRPFKARIELGVGYGGLILRPAEGDEIRDTGAFAEAAFVMRHRWGSIRVSAFYDAGD